MRFHPKEDSFWRDSMLCSARIGSRHEAARAGNHAPINEAATPKPNEMSTAPGCSLGATSEEIMP